MTGCLTTLQGVLSDSPSNVPILLHSSCGEDPALTIEQVCSQTTAHISTTEHPPRASNIPLPPSPYLIQVAACVADGAENPFASFSTMHKLGAMETKDTIRSEVVVVSMGQVWSPSLPVTPHPVEN